VPLRVEIGPRDLEAGVATVADRLGGDKRQVPLTTLPTTIADALETFHAETYDELKEMVEHGFVYATHCGEPASEAAIQEETKATVRCIPLEGPSAEGTVCVHTGRPSGYARKVIFAKAY